jgi:hypothetical protein
MEFDYGWWVGEFWMVISCVGLSAFKGILMRIGEI